jgi:hypothetical protein
MQICLCVIIVGVYCVAVDVCIVSYGLSRAAKHTHTSFDDMILKPLRRARLRIKVIAHFWFKNVSTYSNSWTGEKNVPFDPFDYEYFPVNHVVIEDEPVVDFTPFKLHGNPWQTSNFDPLFNFVLTLMSMQRATDLWNDDDCGSVIYTRPDLMFLDAFNLTWLSYKRSILVPDHAEYPVNDRFAIGPSHIMREYGRRFQFAAAYASTTSLHAEKFLNFVMHKLEWRVLKIPFCFRRFRASGPGLVDCSAKNST